MNKNCNDCYFKSKTLDECYLNYDIEQSKDCDYYRPECKCGCDGEYLGDEDGLDEVIENLSGKITRVDD